jgi:ribonuclease D
LVGTNQDLRELVAYRLGLNGPTSPPALARGWRAEVIGHTLDELLAGQITVRIQDPRAEDPLCFERLDTTGEDKT